MTAALALGTSTYLLAAGLAGSVADLPGCGGGSGGGGGGGGCRAVLGGRWAYWFNLPVSAGADIVYLAALAASLRVRPDRAPAAAAGTLIFCAWIAAGAALWFTLLQALVLGRWCLYCLVAHAAGLAMAAGVFVFFRQTREEVAAEFRARIVPLRAAGIAAMGALALLAGGQVWGPRPDSHALVGADGRDRAPSAGSIPGRSVSYLAGAVEVDLGDVPLLGEAGAAHVLTEVFDYTCGTCRSMSGALELVRRRYPGQIAIALLPAPLERACNRHLPAGTDSHPGACALAECALAVWRVDPRAFPGFHRWMFSQRDPPAPDDARREAGKRVGDDNLAGVLASAWPAGRLAANVEIYRKLTRASPKMPKLLISDDNYLQGLPRDASTLFRILEAQLGIRPGEGGAGGGG